MQSFHFRFDAFLTVLIGFFPRAALWVKCLVAKIVFALVSWRSFAGNHGMASDSNMSKDGRCHTRNPSNQQDIICGPAKNLVVVAVSVVLGVSVNSFR